MYLQVLHLDIDQSICALKMADRICCELHGYRPVPQSVNAFFKYYATIPSGGCINALHTDTVGPMAHPVPAELNKL